MERFDVEKSLTDTEYLSEALTTGQSLGYFPEGTFSRMPGLLPFHMGAFTIAVMTGTPIQPIAIRGARATLREGTAFPPTGPYSGKNYGPDSSTTKEREPVAGGTGPARRSPEGPPGPYRRAGFSA